MPENALQTLRLVGFAMAIAVALVLQRRSPHAGKRGSTLVNGSLWLLNLAIIGTLCGACACSVAQWAAGTHLGLMNSLNVPIWLGVPASLLLLDLVSYAWHRANHLVPFLWRWHRVHHSDPAFSVSTSLRFHPGELVLSLPLRPSAVALLGVPVVAVVVFEIVFTFANAIEHGDIDLPERFERRIGRVLVTPALHRRHHSVARPDRDRNFGTIFSFWDRLLDSYAPNTSKMQVNIGLPGCAEVSFQEALLMPLRR